MSSLSTYSAGAVLAHLVGKTTFSPPTASMALFRASAGQSPRSTAVTANQTTIPATPNGRMYRCTTAGTTGASEPTWGTTNNGTTTDGTAVWTDMTADFLGNTSYLTGVEANYTGYARSTTTGSQWNSPLNSTITNSSSGIPFGQNTGGTTNVIAAAGLYDSATSGGSNNLLVFEIATTSGGVLSVGPNVTPSFGSAAFLAQFQ